MKYIGGTLALPQPITGLKKTQGETDSGQPAILVAQYVLAAASSSVDLTARSAPSSCSMTAMPG